MNKDKLFQEFENRINNQKVLFNTFINETLGEGWVCLNCSHSDVIFSVWDKENDKPIFGQQIEIRRDQDWGSEVVEYTTNIGSCGKSNIDNVKVIGDRAFFYAGLGKLLNNEKALETIKTYIEQLNNSLKELQKEYEKQK